MGNIEDILKNLPSDGNTSLDTQIIYMEASNKLFKTPLSIAILNSLVELRGIKKKDVLKKQMEYQDTLIKNKLKTN
jgi:hypothetical protein